MNNYHSFMHRLASYRDWPLNFPSAYSLAETGLFYSGRSDEVHCYKCQCRISHWKEQDIPVERHKHAKPDCPLVASYSLPVLVTLPSSTSGLASSSAIPQHYITSVQPEPEPDEKVIRPTLPQQIVIKKSIEHVPVSCHPLTFENMSCSELQFADMNSEAGRLCTFANWSCKHVQPKDLAKAGFFSLNIGDCVKCAFCDVVLKQWEAGDVPLEEHRKHKPNCRFVQGLNVGNGPIETVRGNGPIETVRGLPVNANKCPALSMPPSSTGQAESCKNSPLPSSVCEKISAKSGDFSERNHRLSSFADHFHQLRHHNPDALADAGFYYVGPADSVKCFSCGGVLRNWSHSDEPWIEHAKWYPRCAFLLEKKGQAFIEDIKRQREILERKFPISSSIDPKDDQKPMSNKNKIVMPPGEEFEDPTNLKLPYLSTVTSSPQPSTIENFVVASASSFPAESSSNNLERLKNTDEKLENVAKTDDRQGDVLLCKICMDETANTVFLPCGHLLCCEKCSPLVSECPVCRGAIKGTLKVYIP